MQKWLLRVFQYIYWVTAVILVAISFLLFEVVHSTESGVLKVAFLDVGQGDAIYIQSPTGTKTLIDAGANLEVVRELSSVTPFFTESLDLIIGTHPDGDHVGGFPDVLSVYSVHSVMYQGMKHNAPAADAFERSLIHWRLTHGGDTAVWQPHRGDVIDLGGGAYLTILYPDSMPAEDEEDTNRFSIVAKLVFGNTSFVFTGDAPQEVEDYLVSRDGLNLKTNVLKLGHHGSHTSSSESFLLATKPDVAIISRGCDNTYGHPHKEVLERLDYLKISYVDTCKEGTVAFESDGESVERK